ncbi:hypothetical protein [Blastococcus xanthinilyticus]|uniref:Uncharacterized protein n=1 Tax=Blastococcus xanthinilyticus TaxID=1564164 RepID=A0A5S5CYH0_9ACTN|nr:hypothetical protein [Blastococcus xanthinilyticus]TYP88585.1 hypothetical protein BD833_104293 [Blastococcus xanthinilyticus]
MSDPHPRPLAAIDADLHSCRTVRRDAERELAEVRRRQEELADLEAVLLVTIDTRTRLVDHLLDERLRTVPGPAARLPATTVPRRRLTPLG